MAGPSAATEKYALPFPTDEDDVDVPRDLEALARRVEAVFSPFIPGEMKMWPTDVAPDGWILARGQGNVPAADNPGLNAIFGNTGGWINMPDFRDRFPVGAGPTIGLNTVGGAASVTLTIAQMPSHGHNGATTDGATPDHLHASPTIFDHSHVAYGAGAGGRFFHNQNWGQGGVGFQQYIGGGATWLYHIDTTAPAGHAQAATTGASDRSLAHTHSVSVGAQGGDTAHENRPPFRAVNIIIKGG